MFLAIDLVYAFKNRQHDFYIKKLIEKADPISSCGGMELYKFNNEIHIKMLFRIGVQDAASGLIQEGI